MNITFIVDFPEYFLQISFYYSPLTWPWICPKLLSSRYCTGLFHCLLIYTTLPMFICLGRAFFRFRFFYNSFPIIWVQVVFSPVLAFRCLCPFEPHWLWCTHHFVLLWSIGRICSQSKSLSRFLCCRPFYHLLSHRTILFLGLKFCFIFD